MLKLLYHFLRGMLIDEGAARRYLRGASLGLSVVAAQVAVLPTEQVEALFSSPRKALVTLLPGAIAAFGGMIAHGDKTPLVLRQFATDLENRKGRQN